MLTFRHLTSDRTGYYLADLATELPPPRGGADGRGVWVGRAAAGLGLHGPVAPRPFSAVLAGRHPGTGQLLRSGRATVRGYDLTFSAPKSASVLMALGGEEVAHHVVAGHAEAVGAALGYMEEHGVSAGRRVGAERVVVATDGVVAASFTHGVNRNLDPHLHTHVVMGNLVHGEDSRWSACDQRGLSAHRQAGAAVYAAHLRAELTGRLAVQWSQAPLERAEIDGVSPALLGEFSSRAADIRRHSFETGVHSARGNRIAWAVTRPAKGPGVTWAAVQDEWYQRAVAVLGSTPELSAALGHRRPERPSLSEHQFASVLSHSADGGAHRREVVAAFADGARHGVRADALDHLTELWLPAQPAVGVAEPLHARRDVTPRARHLRALGPRPLDPVAHGVWKEAASGIDRYRQRWGVREPDALGLTGDQPRWPTARLVDHLRATQVVELARARLGRTEPRALELDRGR
jgi:conjugative relaxase-like TrwC/TraI family protein